MGGLGCHDLHQAPGVRWLDLARGSRHRHAEAVAPIDSGAGCQGVSAVGRPRWQRVGLHVRYRPRLSLRRRESALMSPSTSIDLALRRLVTQRLVGTGFKRPVEAVSWFGAVQSQDYAGAKWA